MHKILIPKLAQNVINSFFLYPTFSLEHMQWYHLGQNLLEVSSIINMYLLLQTHIYTEDQNIFFFSILYNYLILAFEHYLYQNILWN